VCIRDGALLADASRPRRYSEEQYLKTPAEMAELFADAPELLVNTSRSPSAVRWKSNWAPPCCRLTRCRPAAPPNNFCARRRAAASMSGSRRPARCRGVVPDAAKAYAERLSLELGVICSMGFAGYFLIVADFIRWARDNGVPVGPGPRLGRGLLGGVRPRHHRSRSDRA
jgi:DNA polymerase-3 subunit alpha